MEDNEVYKRKLQEVELQAPGPIIQVSFARPLDNAVSEEEVQKKVEPSRQTRVFVCMYILFLAVVFVWQVYNCVLDVADTTDWNYGILQSNACQDEKLKYLRDNPKRCQDARDYLRRWFIFQFLEAAWNAFTAFLWSCATWSGMFALATFLALSIAMFFLIIPALKSGDIFMQYVCSQLSVLHLKRPNWNSTCRCV
jgi:hypothetical protein